MLHDGKFRIVQPHFGVDMHGVARGQIGLTMRNADLINLLVAEGVGNRKSALTLSEAQAALRRYRYTATTDMQRVLGWYMSDKSRSELVEVVRGHFAANRRLYTE